MIICFCLNNLGALGLGATLTSLIKNCSDTAKLQLYFLCSFVDEEIKKSISILLREINFKGSFDFIDFDPFKTFGNYKSLQNDWTPYGRLLIADILDCKEVLYLDTDLVIETDILKLFNTGMENSAIGAIPAGTMRYALENEFFIKALKNPDLKVFNSGVLLINIVEWKKNKIKKKLLELGDKYPTELLAADQTLLNAYFAGNFFHLPLKYNVTWYASKEPDIETDAIFHFVGSPKPWDFFGKYLHSGYKKWERYNSISWEKNVLNRHKIGQLRRFWTIRSIYIKVLLKNNRR